MATKPKATSNVPAVAESHDVVLTERPDWLPANDDRGAEGVGMEDLVIPRLEVAQALSPCVDKEEPEYIEGCEAGMLYNTVTREVYPDGVLICPVKFQKQYLVWKDRKADPKAEGFFGSYDTELLAKEAVDQLVADGEKAKLVTNPTAVHFGFIVKADGKTEQIAISMAKTKMKISRAWNTLVQLAGGSRFSRVYRITSQSETNDKGKYYNFTVKMAGYPQREVYDKADALYELLKTVSVRADNGSAPDGEIDDEDM